ncbi:hypothetical protein ACLOJK_008307 [Asimina triloba]
MEKRFCIFLSFAVLVAVAKSTTFTFTNNCPYTVWAGTLNNADKPPLSQTGFELRPGTSTAVDAPVPWGGRFWGRSYCSTDANRRVACATADCGSGAIPCNGGGAAPPATLVEFTLGGSGGQDFYDTSLVDGFNIPFSATPVGNSASGCRASGCPANVNEICPPELRMASPDGATIGCKSACAAFDTDEYCCRGEFGTPDKCHPTSYSMIFKNACPLAYSYAYDDASSTFTCSTGADYLLTFCP